VVDLDRPHLSPVISVPDLIVKSMHASDVVMTLVDGEILYDRGQWPTINHERAEYDFKCSVRRLGV
jgi:5-methylthioadenosine/S-adenosylhomocysteine deaminase